MPDLATLNTIAMTVAALAIVGWKVVEYIRGSAPRRQEGELLVSEKNCRERHEEEDRRILDLKGDVAELRGRVEAVVLLLGKLGESVARIEGRLEERARFCDRD